MCVVRPASTQRPASCLLVLHLIYFYTLIHSSSHPLPAGGVSQDSAAEQGGRCALHLNVYTPPFELHVYATLQELSPEAAQLSEEDVVPNTPSG